MKTRIYAALAVKGLIAFSSQVLAISYDICTDKNVGIKHWIINY